ncbi:hypothetical protein [Saccharospirillum impatiens]|uniref:hypothetical protein n=1 Tax=Saccharospirillum impatiens TaxID=169438 RepID=UPI00040A042F|nr:hypothetical protein [Saccharospirillum impatiens]
MKITKNALGAAVKEGILTQDQSIRLHAFLQGQPDTGPSFNFTHLLYYLGGLIAIGAMTLFMGLGWEAFGGWGIVCISVSYAVLGLALAHRFQRNGHAIPAGICATFAVFLTPLLIYGLQQALGVWPEGSDYRDYHRYIKWHWLYMELGTLAAGVIIARLYKYPFLVMPIAATLWYLSMDLAVMLFGDWPPYELRALVSLYFGALMLGLAFWVDVRARHTADYAFWLYLFGVLTFWGGLTSQNSDNELSKLLYFGINLLMMGIGVLLVRRVFVVFGAIGSSIYLGYLAHTVFEESLLFPIALTAIGLAIIYLGVLWQKNEQHLTSRARRHLPRPLREMLEAKD